MKNRLIIIASLLVAPDAFADEMPDYRLPDQVRPVSQRIELRLDPAAATYTGRTTILLDVERPVDRIALNQVGLDMTSIVLSTGGNERSLEATDADWDQAWLSDGITIEPGDYSLTIDFAGSFSTDALGMYRVNFEGNDYVFTQMEAMYARRAFPVFDEPSIKIPYELVISAPGDIVVVANTPVESVSEDGDWQTVSFLPTPPLPSYLLALAAGPLDRAPIEGISVPGHIYVPKGYADRLGFVLRETPTIVADLEDYFGSKYPFRKLDFIAVPEYAFGAMENPGLITYRTDLLLVGDDVAGGQAEAVLRIIAHEVAHIWFGDVVTMAWWNDLWLNEAFATWMASTVLERRYPQYDPDLKLPQQMAFAEDQLTTSKPMRRTVRSEDEMMDGLMLDYSKGHTLLRMLEHYVGPDVWQRAMRKYVGEFAYSNATEQDLWAVVSRESGLDIAAIAGGYLNQPGFALVSITGAGDVSQKRYTRQGHEVEELLWQIPLNVKYKVDGDVRQTFMLLKGETGSLDVPASEWIFPDAGGNGYYRWMIDAQQFDDLITDIDLLSEREKIAVLDNSESLLNAGMASMVDHLSVVQALLRDEHPLVFLPALEGIKKIGEDFVTEESRQAFAGFIDEFLSARFEEIGVETRPDDSEATIQMRPRLLRTLGQFGSDESVRDAAYRLTDRYLDDPESVETRLALEAMRISAWNGGEELYDRFRKTYLDSRSADQRTNILSAVYFRDPAILLRHLDFTLTDAVQAGDMFLGLYFSGFVLDDHAPLYAWLEKNLDPFLAKAPSFLRSVLPRAVGGTCSPDNLRLLNAFFADRGEIYAASLAKASESVRSCIERRERHSADFERFLQMHRDAVSARAR